MPYGDSREENKGIYYPVIHTLRRIRTFFACVNPPSDFFPYLGSEQPSVTSS
jgi:hypothetical protein